MDAALLKQMDAYQDPGFIDHVVNKKADVIERVGLGSATAYAKQAIQSSDSLRAHHISSFRQNRRTLHRPAAMRDKTMWSPTA